MDALQHLLKAGDFTFEVLDARRGDAVGADAAVAGGGFPLGLDEIVFQHALQGGVERALFHLQQLVGTLLDVLDEGVAVHGLAAERLEDHHLQRAAEEVALIGFGGGRHRPM